MGRWETETDRDRERQREKGCIHVYTFFYILDS